MSDRSVCALCGRARPLTFHHLIPRAVHRKKRYKKLYSKEQMRLVGLWLCRLCHVGVHDLIPDEKELARDYNTRERLLAHPAIARHVDWVRKQT
jgi:hypothetical protein